MTDEDLRPAEVPGVGVTRDDRDARRGVLVSGVFLLEAFRNALSSGASSTTAAVPNDAGVSKVCFFRVLPCCFEDAGVLENCRLLLFADELGVSNLCGVCFGVLLVEEESWALATLARFSAVPETGEASTTFSEFLLDRRRACGTSKLSLAEIPPPPTEESFILLALCGDASPAPG